MGRKKKPTPEETPATPVAPVEPTEPTPEETPVKGAVCANNIQYNGRLIAQGQSLTKEDVKLLESIGLGHYVK